MIVALAGRRIDATNSDSVIFPIEHIEIVKNRIGELFESVKVQMLICSAACGADLLALDVAGSLGIKRKIVLPYVANLFKLKSVIDRPGNWSDLFDNIYQQINESKDILVLNYKENEEHVYEKTNLAILDLALEQSNKSKKISGYSNDPIAVIVWDRKPRKSKDLTFHFKQEAEKRSLLVKEINTL